MHFGGDRKSEEDLVRTTMSLFVGGIMAFFVMLFLSRVLKVANRQIYDGRCARLAKVGLIARRRWSGAWQERLQAKTK